MRTNYLLRNNKTKKKSVVTGIIVALFLAVFTVTGLFSSAFFKAMTFLSMSSDGVGQTASSFSALFSSRASLEEENEKLKNEVALLETRLADKNAVVAENARLKASAYLKEDTGRVQARLLSKPPFTPFDIITVEGGTEQGINENSRVMLGSLFLGMVTSSSNDQSRITLLSTPGGKIDAFIGESALPATFVGKGGGNFEASLPQGSSVSEGDLVFTFLDSDLLYIGNVISVIQDGDNTLMRVLLKLPVNLYELSYVEIIPSAQP